MCKIWQRYFNGGSVRKTDPKAKPISPSGLLQKMCRGGPAVSLQARSAICIDMKVIMSKLKLLRTLSN